MKKKLYRERYKKDVCVFKQDKYFTFEVDDVDVNISKPKKKKKSDK